MCGVCNVRNCKNIFVLPESMLMSSVVLVFLSLCTLDFLGGLPYGGSGSEERLTPSDREFSSLLESSSSSRRKLMDVHTAAFVCCSS